MTLQAADLVAQLLSGDEARAEAAAAACAQLSPDQSGAALERLAALAAAASPEQRGWAVQALAALKHVDALPLLLAALQDAAAEVRQCAALGLRLRPDARAALPLAQALHDSDALTARLAVDALAAIGPPAVPALLDTLNGAAPPARLGALRALAAIGDSRAIPALFAALDGTTLEEYWASAALERMGVGMSFFHPSA